MKLTEHQSLPSSGARSVELFKIEGEQFLALPQLAEDIAGDPANMNGGDSDVDVLIYQWRESEFHEYQRIPSHGNEHISFYAFDGRYFLAVASIRSGKQPNFKTSIQSVVYEWQADQFVEFQRFDTFAAKGCKFFSIENQHYIGFSEGVKESETDNDKDINSHLYRWNGEQFEAFQSLPSTWGYDMTFFQMDNRYFLAIADNLAASTIYEWNGKQFPSFQAIEAQGGGRHFCYFTANNQHYIAFANLLHDSTLYCWNGDTFVATQTLTSAGARSFSVLQANNETYLFRTNFITGTREQPVTEMDSIIYQLKGEQLVETLTYKTDGGTDSNTFNDNNRTYLVVSNSLSKDIRFKTPSKIYKMTL